MNLLALADFNLVATHGGFGRASRASGRPKATLSRRVMELEQSLGMRLLERGAHSLQLTEAGAELFSRAGALLGELDELGETIGAGLDRPRGSLRISVPLLFGQLAMGKIAAAFAAAYPDVRLEVVANDRFVDLVEEQYDLVIRANPHPDESLVGRCFRRDHLVVVAPPSMCRPLPAADSEPAEPIPAVCLMNTSAESRWHFTDGEHRYVVTPDQKLRFSSIAMVRDAAVTGAGAATLPRSLVQEDLTAGRLVSWGMVEGRDVAVWVLHTSRRLASKKVSAFVEFLCDEYTGNVTQG